MKRGTPEHFKTMRLATLLSVERPCDRAEALGIVEALCNHFAPRSAPQGNVGRCTNQEIADGCYTTRDADVLVRALVESRWLDEHPDFRLVIHDWKEHADEAVRKWLIRNKLLWCTPSGFCRVVVRKASRQRRDGVRPPRAGNGNGNGNEKFSGGGAGEPPAFTAFYERHPRNADRPEALRTWRQLDPDGALVAKIMDGLNAWCAFWRRDQTEPKYIKAPAPWLRLRRWESAPPAPGVKAPPRRLSETDQQRRLHRDQDAHVRETREGFAAGPGPTLLRDVLATATKVVVA